MRSNLLEINEILAWVRVGMIENVISVGLSQRTTADTTKDNFQGNPRYNTVDDMRTAQRNDITLEKYREYANSGTRKFTGQQNVSWFVMEDDLLFRYFQSPKERQDRTRKNCILQQKYLSCNQCRDCNSCLTAHVHASEYSQAITYYSQAIEQNPYVAAYYGNRSFAHIKTESFGYALSDASKALQLVKNYVKTYDYEEDEWKGT
uniref:Tetratricopeptide repeat protein n=1 Tax=Magallana gigas TaxID=29159 RepID=A0A8W8IE74_MAGGI